MKCLIHPPKLPNDKNPFTVFIAYVVRWVTSERVTIKGWTYDHTADGKIFYPPGTTPGGNNGLFFGDKIELPAGAYVAFAKSQVIHIQASHAIVTTGVRDAAHPTLPPVKSRPGMWVALRSVPAQATSGGNPVWNLPQWPMPDPSNYDAAANFWLWLGEQYC